MKTINLFDKELRFNNEELYKCAEIAINSGYKVHTFNPSGSVIKQIFIDNGIIFGSIDANYGGIKRSTCHKPAHGIGSGFGFENNECINASKEAIESVLVFAPVWVGYNDLKKVVKQSWSEYLKKDTILKYAEIIF